MTTSLLQTILGTDEESVTRKIKDKKDEKLSEESQTRSTEEREIISPEKKAVQSPTKNAATSTTEIKQSNGGSNKITVVNHSQI